MKIHNTKNTKPQKSSVQRKQLIRKHFIQRCFQKFANKYKQSDFIGVPYSGYRVVCFEDIYGDSTFEYPKQIGIVNKHFNLDPEFVQNTSECRCEYNCDCAFTVCTARRLVDQVLPIFYYSVVYAREGARGFNIDQFPKKFINAIEYDKVIDKFHLSLNGRIMATVTECLKRNATNEELGKAVRDETNSDMDYGKCWKDSYLSDREKQTCKRIFTQCCQQNMIANEEESSNDTKQSRRT